MKRKIKTKKRLHNVYATKTAIQTIPKGEVDAVVVQRRKREQTYSLENTITAEILENISDGFYAFDNDWHYTYVSKKVEKILQRKRSEIVGKSVFTLFPDIEQNKFFKQFKKAKRLHKPVHFEEYADSQKKWYHVYAFPSENGLSVYFNDRTLEKVAQEKSSYLASIVSSSDDAIIGKDLHGTITSWNKGAERIYQYTASEMIGQSITKLFPKERKNEFNHIMRKLKKGENIDNYETIRVPKNGAQIPVSVTISPIRDEHGIIIGASSIGRDISEQKIYQESVRKNTELLQHIIQIAPVGIHIFDAEGRYIMTNSAAEEIVGNTKESWNGKFYTKPPFTRLTVTGEPFPPEKHPFVVVKKTGKPVYDCEMIVMSPTGKRTIISVNAAPLHDAVGDFAGAIASYVDITHRAEIEKRKDDFMGIASHELKTPVTSLKAYAQVLQRRFKKRGDTDSASLLEKMNGQLSKLTNLIGDLLDVTKIESGRLMIHLTKFDFDALVDNCIEELQRTTDRHKIIRKGYCKKQIRGDQERISQVLTNLISNAIKYSPHEKEIIVTVTGDSKNITLSVQDFGVGIPKDKQEKVFQRFFRVSGPRQDTFPGLGLGLYISSQIVQRQGGKIWVESIEGRGATFFFTLPLKTKVVTQNHTVSHQELQHA